MYGKELLLIKMFQFIKNKYYRSRPTVRYWKTQDSAQAKLTLTDKGHYEMWIDGEDYPFPGWPRGVLLFSSFSKLKHEIKNQIFNDIWKELEEGKGEEEIIRRLKKETLPKIWEIAEKSRFDMLPYERFVPPVKELWRAMTVVEKKTNSKTVKHLKEVLCFILQEDDAYRFRAQWLVKFFNPTSLWRKILKRNPIDDFELALNMLEHAEVIGDMKERIRLLRRVLLFCLKDPNIRTCFDLLVKEMDWNKFKLTKADKYFFRAKYFKVDFPEYGY